MNRIWLFCAVLLSIFCLTVKASVNGYIRAEDTKKFFSIAVTGLTNLEDADVSTIYYAANVFDMLKEPSPKVLYLNSCAYVQKHVNELKEPEALFHALKIWSIQKCATYPELGATKLHTPATVKALKDAVESDQSTTANIRYALEALQVIGESVPAPAKVAQLLQAQLKQDDGLQSLGQALHAASLLGSSGQFALQRVEDAIVQADEVDGQMLQWEGGLTTTSLLLTALLRLPGAKPITQVQADKFATYLLTRKTVHTHRTVSALIEGVVALSKSSVAPVSITLAKSAQVTPEKPDLAISISTLLGEPVRPAPSPVVAQLATRVEDDVVVLSKKTLSAGSGPTEFILPLGIDAGQYRLAITAGSHSGTLLVRVLGKISLKYLEAGLVDDSDATSSSQLKKVDYPGKLAADLQADSSQRLVVRFSLSRPVHQAFLRLYAGKREIVFVAEQDSNKIYKVDVKLASELSYTAAFDMELLLGDAIVSNPMRWNFGGIDVKLGAPLEPKAATRGPKLEIRHMFRPADKRPPQIVSLLFTGLCLAPLLLLFVLWIKLGVNFRNFSVSALPFHAGLGGIFGLFTLFWLKLDMFTTCGWLLPLGAFTFLAGQRTLSSLAKQRKV